MTGRAPRPAICLRCDWSGEASGRSCPGCGAGLFRPPAVPPPRQTRPAANPAAAAAKAAAQPVAAGPAAVRPGIRSATPSETGVPNRVSPGALERSSRSSTVTTPEEPPTTRRAGPIVTLVAGVVIAALVFSWIQSNTPTRPAADATVLTGTLLYAVDDGPGWSRLWKWDLETGQSRPGPRVREPIELVNGDGADIGVVGVTSRAPDGDMVGSILRFLSSADRPTPLVRGDLVTWGARGAAVVSVKHGPLDGPCLRHLVIVTKTITPAIEERQFDATMCGDILSAGRDANTTYFTLQHGDRVDIRYAGYGRTHPVLRDFALLSISPASDLLVIPSDELPPPTVVPLAVREAGDPVPVAVFGTALFYRGLSHRPKPYGMPGARLWVDQVLAWSRDSTSALVAGHVGVRIGIFEVRTGPGTPTAPPHYVGPIDGSTWATFADHHVGFVLTAGRISTYRDGELTPLPLPEGAPAPDGPIVWMA